jgi:hypothetical protein
MEGEGVRFCKYGAGLLVVGDVSRGRGRSRSLALEAFRRLAPRFSASGISLSGSRTRARRLMVISLANCAGSNVNEEGPDLLWDNDRAKEELSGGVAAA